MIYEVVVFDLNFSEFAHQAMAQALERDMCPCQTILKTGGLKLCGGSASAG